MVNRSRVDTDRGAEPPPSSVATSNAAAERTPVTILAVCPTCTEIRYRTKSPIRSVEECRPEAFEPVDGAPPPLGEGPPLCHVCGALLAFTTEDRFRPFVRTTSARTVGGPSATAVSVSPTEGPPGGGGPAPALPVLVVPVFEAGKDEVINDVRDLRGGGLLVITNRRLVLVGAR